MESVELKEIRKLEEKFDKHIEEDKKYMDDMRNELKQVWHSLGDRVTWGWLWTIVIFCVAGATTVAGLLYNEIKDMRTDQTVFFDKQAEKSTSIQSDISQIKGKLEPYKVEFRD